MLQLIQNSILSQPDPVSWTCFLDFTVYYAVDYKVKSLPTPC